MYICKFFRTGILLKVEKMSLSWCFGNYYSVCKRIKNLPPLLSAVVIATHLPHIRKLVLNQISRTV